MAGGQRLGYFTLMKHFGFILLTRSVSVYVSYLTKVLVFGPTLHLSLSSNVTQ